MVWGIFHLLCFPCKKEQAAWWTEGSQTFLTCPTSAHPPPGFSAMTALRGPHSMERWQTAPLTADGVQDTLPQSTAPWHIEYLRMKELWEMAEARRSLWPPPMSPFFPEAGHKTSVWKVPSLYQEEGRHSFHQRLGIWGQKICTNLVELTLFFLVTSSPITPWAQTPLSCPFFTNVLFLCLKGVKASCSGHFSGSSFSGEGSHVRVKIQ